jgi:hypothetical protein
MLEIRCPSGRRKNEIDRPSGNCSLELMPATAAFRDKMPTCRDVRDCRVGDWQHVSFVYEWRGRTSPQSFQPNAERRCPFDAEKFRPDETVWKFRRGVWPGMDKQKGLWDVWLRVE